MKQAATQVYLDKQLAPVFEGYLPCISKDNEAAAWRYIDKVCDEALAKYPTTLEQDVEIIEKDAEERKLSVNKRNCVLYRMTEKYVLHYLKDCANIVEQIV